MNKQYETIKKDEVQQKKLSYTVPLSHKGHNLTYSDNHTHHPIPIKTDRSNNKTIDKNIDINQNKINFNSLDLNKIQISDHHHHQKNSKTDVNYQHGTDHNMDTRKRLNLIKNQFQMLREIMIDSTIVDNHHKNQDKAKEKQSSLKVQNLKMGQLIRGKQKHHHHKNKINSQQISQLKTERIRVNQKNHKNQHPSHIEHQKSKNLNKKSKTQKNLQQKQYHSQNTKDFQNTSRIAKRRQQIKYGSFISNQILQKQSLQLQLKSSLEKTQNLIQSQIQLKSKNHRLEQTLRKCITNNNDNQLEILQTTIKQLKFRIAKYQDQLSRQRSTHKQLIQKLSRLQASAVTNQAALSLMSQQKAKQQNTIMTMKLAYATLQIQNKKLHHQKQIDQKHYQNEVFRLKQQIQFIKTYLNNKSSTNYQKDKIKFLQQQLDDKDHKYRQLLQQIQNKRQTQDQINLIQLTDKLNKTKQQRQAQISISNDLKQLKQQMSKLKHEHKLTQNQLGIQNKLFLFQKALKLGNQQRQKHQVQMQVFHNQYESLNHKYHTLQQQHQQSTNNHLKTINALKLQLDSFKSNQESYHQAKQQNKLLSQKISQLELQIKNYQSIQSELFKLKQVLRKKDLIHHLQIENAKKKVDSAQFTAFKTQQQGKFNLDLNTRKHTSQLQILTKQLKATQADRDYHKQQLMNLKKQSSDLLLKYKDLSFSTNHQSASNYASIQQLTKQYEQQISAITKKYHENQQKSLQQLINLTKINQEKMILLQKCAALENQNYQLKTLCKKNINVDASVMHLWGVKLIQYKNMKLLLDYVKGNLTMIPNKQSELIQQRGLTNFQQNRQGSKASHYVPPYNNYQSTNYYNNASQGQNSSQTLRPIQLTNAPWHEGKMILSTFQKNQYAS